MKPTIVISAVNLVNGGPFTILKTCLDELDNSSLSLSYRVVAFVARKQLLPVYKNIELVEFPKAKRSYLLRMYYEYIYFYKLSKKLNPKLWVSLHDLSPRVVAEKQAVYMHNAIVFSGRPTSFSLRGIVFSGFYKYAYRLNIKANDYLIVQQDWLRNAFSEMFGFSKDKIIVARPNNTERLVLKEQVTKESEDKNYSFFFPSFPRDFKNFEIICEATRIILEKGYNQFEVFLTLSGNENKYSEKIVREYSNLKPVNFIGLQDKEHMVKRYEETNCLVFPSKLESWGLPISEFLPLKKPMILADLPYAHETAAGADAVAFFNPNNAEELANRMIEIMEGKRDFFQPVPDFKLNAPNTQTWEELFNELLNG